MDNVNDVTVDLSDDTSTMSYDDYYYYSRQLDNIINNQTKEKIKTNITTLNKNKNTTKITKKRHSWVIMPQKSIIFAN